MKSQDISKKGLTIWNVVYASGLCLKPRCDSVKCFVLCVSEIQTCQIRYNERESVFESLGIFYLLSTVKTRVQGQGSRSKSLHAGRSPECIVFLWEGQGQGPYPLLRHCWYCWHCPHYWHSWHCRECQQCGQCQQCQQCPQCPQCPQSPRGPRSGQRRH